MSRLTSFGITLLAFLCIAVAWEAFARYGGYPPS